MQNRSAESYARTVLEGEAQKVRETGEGGRNNALNQAAFTVGGCIGAGLLERAEAAEVLTAAALETGLPLNEIRDTLASSFKAGEAKPFDLSSMSQVPTVKGGRQGRPPKPIPAPSRTISKARPLTAGEIQHAQKKLKPVQIGSTAHADLKRRGLLDSPHFQHWQNAKGELVFEVRGPDGQPWGYKVRSAEEKHGRYRYLTQGLGTPAWASPEYGNTETAWVIEGELNAVAAFTAFSTAGRLIDVQGIGGVNGRPHLEALKGKEVFVYADADLAGEKALKDWAQMALEAGAKAVYGLPPLPPKKDFCDVLGHEGPQALANLLGQLARDAKAYEPQETAAEASGPYFTEGGALFWNKPTREGSTVPVKLANFNARIAAQTVRDDGAEREHLLTLGGTLEGGKPLPLIDVPSNQFGGMGWVLAQWGAEAIIQPGQTTKDHIRAAIQQLSQRQMEQRQVYAFTGWRETPEGAVYLHAGGALGAGGPLAGFEVDLPSPLARYHLPEPLTGSALADGLRASLSILDLVPDEVSIPLFAGVWRAVLGKSDFALWLMGETGQGKSELAALLLQHFGPEMDARSFPGNWSSTANSLEGLAFAAQHALIVIDDFAPQGTIQELARYHATAERLLRAQGNNAGRGRMTAQGQVRLEKYPRGLILATGEEAPKGHSARARALVVELPKGGMNWATLTHLQKQGKQGIFAGVMAAFLQWLAPMFKTLPEQRQTALERGRTVFTGPNHARSSSAVTELLWASEVFLTFAQAHGGLNAQEVNPLQNRFLRALLECLKRQGQHHKDADPVARFQEVLWAMLSTGQGHLADLKTGEKPTQDEGRYGWKSWENSYRASGTQLGWVDDRGIYLTPDAAYKAVSDFIRGQGDALPMSAQTLWKRLAERKLIRKSETDRNTIKVTAARSRHTVIHLLTGGYGSESGTTETIGADDVPDGLNRVPFSEFGGTAQEKTGTIQTTEPAPLTQVPESPSNSPKDTELEVSEW